MVLDEGVVDGGGGAEDDESKTVSAGIGLR
jgi:hypothetical protein